MGDVGALSALSRLGRIAATDPGVLTAEREVVRPVSLERAISELDARYEATHIRSSRLERARLAWPRHLSGEEVISRQDVLALCWDEEIAHAPEFSDEVVRHLPLRSSALRGLMAGYHLGWSTHMPGLELALNRSFEALVRCRDPLESWKERRGELIGSEAPALFARRCFDGRISVTAEIDRLGLPRASKFASTAAHEVVRLTTAGTPPREDLDFALKVLLEDNDLLEPIKWGLAFAYLISRPELSADEAARSALIDLALHTRGLPDPRMRSAGWENVPGVARLKILQWLSEEDLRFFFDLIMEGQEDPQGRYPFWLPYVGVASQARVVVGKQDLERLRPQLAEIRSRGRSFAKMRSAGGANAHVSAFIMDFGSVTIVEFSKPNSACYFYANPKAGTYFDFSQQGYEWHDLKDTYHGEYFAHSSGWEIRFQHRLAGHGIRPE